MGRLQELAAQAAGQASAQRQPAPRAVQHASDVLEALRPHPIARRLPLSFSAERLQADLAQIDESWWGRHLGPYHDGQWEAVALWAPRGDRREQRSMGGDFAATEAMSRCPYMAEVLTAFPGEKNRVRLMRLRRGGHILPHSDPLHQISAELIRVHVPVVTSRDVRFVVNGRRIVMNPGEVWHVDVRFRHEVHNESDRDRIHLVIDLVANAAVRQLLERGDAVGRGFLTGYYLRHSLPESAKRYLNVGN